MSTNTYPIFFESSYLSDSASSIYILSGASTSILQDLVLKFTNLTGATRLVTAYAYTSGSPSLENALIYNHTVPPYDYIEVPVPRIGNGGKVDAFCDVASAVNVQAIGGKIHVP